MFHKCLPLRTFIVHYPGISLKDLNDSTQIRYTVSASFGFESDSATASCPLTVCPVLYCITLVLGEWFRVLRQNNKIVRNIIEVTLFSSFLQGSVVS